MTAIVQTGDVYTVFVATPRSASTSLMHYAVEYAKQNNFNYWCSKQNHTFNNSILQFHDNVEYLQSIFKTNQPKQFISILRNPFELVISVYRYFCDEHALGNHSDWLNKQTQRLINKDVKDFEKLSLDNFYHLLRDKHNSINFHRSYYCSKVGTVDHLIPITQVENKLQSILPGIKPNLSVSNISNKKIHLSASPLLEQWICEDFSWEIQQWNKAITADDFLQPV